MKLFLFSTFFLAFFSIGSQNKVDYNSLSENLLSNIIKKKAYQKQVDLLAKVRLTDLVDELKTDKQKIAFWVNIYNAFIQISLSENPNLYKDKSRFFSEQRIKIGGEILSFDDIEHGIIRKSRIKISLGYLRKWFPATWERKLRVKNIDWRIHFALNCGAKSCPPVAIYTAKHLNKELDFMTKTYLKEQTSYNTTTKTAKSVALMSWFRGDFGGKNGAKKILFKYGITSEIPKKIEFKTYDWTLYLNNFRKIPN